MLLDCYYFEICVKIADNDKAYTVCSDEMGFWRSRGFFSDFM